MKSFVASSISILFLLALNSEARGQISETDLPLRGVLPVPVEAEPDAAKLDRSHGEEWHRVTLRLQGSMCPGCLLQLKDQLRKFPGVTFVTIDYKAGAERTAEQGASQAHPHRTASTILIYDRHSIQWGSLEHFIAGKKYHCLGLKDEAIEDAKPK